MPVLDQLRSDVITAMKAGERDRVGVLRMLVAALQQAAKEGGGDEVTVLRRERKRRLEAATQFEAGGREELAAAERAEADVVSGYLPVELTDEALTTLVDGAIAELAADSPRQMGAVIKHVIAAAEGQADGSRVSALVKERLGA